MLKRSVAMVVAAVSIPLLGGVAIALANSVNTNPAPASVPHTAADDKGGVTGAASVTGVTSVTGISGTDDPATHDVNDDKGGVAGGNGADDPATHDVNDDKGGFAPAAQTAAHTTTPTIDDRGGATGGHGADDTSGHDGAHG